MGTEVDVQANFRPFSDVGISVAVGFFFPNSGTGGIFWGYRKAVELRGDVFFSLSLK